MTMTIGEAARQFDSLLSRQASNVLSRTASIPDRSDYYVLALASLRGVGVGRICGFTCRADTARKFSCKRSAPV